MLNVFATEGVPSTPINSHEQSLTDPQVVANDWVQNLTLPNGAEVSSSGPPVKVRL
jgi:crotonobetainyl-CoA:carnitine CoA-transferase CaiB-like acyl-CoA transferase